jgi:hypothetical protein
MSPTAAVVDPAHYPTGAGTSYTLNGVTSLTGGTSDNATKRYLFGWMIS